jgi:cell division protein FtsB
MSTEEEDMRVVVNGRAFERHAQTALVLVLVALLLWVGDTTQNTSLVVAEMRVELAFLKASNEKPSEEIKSLNRRVDSLESLVYAMEQREHEK